MRRILKWRYIALLMAVLLLSAALCACVPAMESPVEETAQPEITLPTPLRDTLTLPFARRDVLNPYQAETELNLLLSTLLYEGLFLTDPAHKAQPVLAESIEQNSPTQWTVTLRANRIFHNGNNITPQDVIYSWNKARASQNYSARVENISNMRERDGNIEIMLHRANVFIAANLDFPIVPNGSAEQGAFAQAQNGYHFSMASTPVGTGRYRLAEVHGAFVLQYDPRHPGSAPALTTIALHGVNNSGALLYGLELGSYQFAYHNLSGGEVPSVAAATFRVPTTNLVFLGMNAGRGALQDAVFRAALAACIDHSTLLRDAYKGYADTTDTPFPASWHALDGHDFARPFNAMNARRGLEELGYNELRNGIRASRQRVLRFDLVVRRGNPAQRAIAGVIRSQLQAFQMEITIRPLNRADYNEAIRTGNFDLYIGELRLTPDLNLSPLLISGGSATRGVQVWGRASSAYGQLLQGLITPERFVITFLEDMPFLPLGYRAGMAAATRSLRTSPELRKNDLFAAIESWEY